jgi:TctA family transporter
MLELSFRQSLAMSAGSYAIFFTRPIATVMLAVGLALLLLGLRPIVSGRGGWRGVIGLEPAARHKGP